MFYFMSSLVYCKTTLDEITLYMQFIWMETSMPFDYKMLLRFYCTTHNNKPLGHSAEFTGPIVKAGLFIELLQHKH